MKKSENILKQKHLSPINPGDKVRYVGNYRRLACGISVVDEIGTVVRVSVDKKLHQTYVLVNWNYGITGRPTWQSIKNVMVI